MNLEIIANESKKNFTDDRIHFDNKNGFSLMKIMLKREFGFKSPKFTFAFKMAVILFVWQLLTLIFNLPFTKWLYFITLPLMMPYINDLKYTAKARIKGTFVGVFLITILMIIMPYVPISVKNFVIITVLVCLFVIIFKIKDKFILTVSSTVISVMFSLMYIELPHAIELKLLWVVIGVVVVSLFNFLFLPYSVEIETKNNLKCCCKLNQKLIELVKDKCKGGGSDEKTTILVVSNVIRENIEVTDENRQLYKLQIKINDICNFILTYWIFILLQVIWVKI